MDDLALVESFLNTVDERTFRRHGTAHAGGERLTSQTALDAWLADQGLPPGARLDAALRLRGALRDSLRGGDPGLIEFPLHLTAAEGGLRLRAAGDTALDRIVEAVARAVVTGAWARMKLCAAPDCRWAFHDTSKSGAGRWCSMNVCGNRAKTRAYRARLHS
ncbi:CGNR zinc finger domain-containing protein [Catenuloplanes atrovinosus]|uniref:Zinc finger CGNR domain-containing protein n=1 Tax=Catenuloplanes atrovinosus TaxID=137266 RepID=A0AAE4C9R5_9ACTN|nr:CGNR zinc finger domain-containing protein [Catenuloplanes atrovinosus]MDR7275054.1 hypothetical protein [Catenuloplanes atrovinosus]